MMVWMYLIELKDDKLIHGLNLHVDSALIPMPGDSINIPRQLKVIERHFNVRGTSAKPEIDVDVFVETPKPQLKVLDGKT